MRGRPAAVLIHVDKGRLRGVQAARLAPAPFRERHLHARGPTTTPGALPRDHQDYVVPPTEAKVSAKYAVYDDGNGALEFAFLAPGYLKGQEVYYVKTPGSLLVKAAPANPNPQPDKPFDWNSPQEVK